MNKNNSFINTLLAINLICFSSICSAKINLNYQAASHAHPTAYKYHGKQALIGEGSGKPKSPPPKEHPLKTVQRATDAKHNNNATKAKVTSPAPPRTHPRLEYSDQASAGLAVQPANHVGLATYYADEFHGKRTASGEIYDKNKLTAVHSDYPFGTVLRVTNLQNHRSVTVRINDRTRLGGNHLLDVSKQAAVELGFLKAGWAKVKIEAI
jgi:rare lipoprotein A (peptidoglycan hydrolase)